ncbi:MAG: hypothetical protein ACPL3C_12415 [Pyrobaculum sp.]
MLFRGGWLPPYGGWLASPCGRWTAAAVAAPTGSPAGTVYTAVYGSRPWVCGGAAV